MNLITPVIGKEFGPQIIPLIKNAEKTIDIIVYNWKWYPDQIGSSIQKFNNAIINAAQRNKRVRAITTSPYIDKVMPRLNISVKRFTSQKLLHTKLMIVDDKIAILGSHNYTMNAFTINYEVSVIIRDSEVVERLRKYFNNLWQ